MSDINRRAFLETSSAGLAAGLAAGLHVVGTAAEKERPPVRLAVMGVHGRGRGLLSGFTQFPEVEVAYVCDPDAAVVAPAVKIVEDRGQRPPKVVKDFRVALDDAEVTALVCAAPDHWHALATIWACQAGKDVYVEKPCSHNVVEGRRMTEAARKYNRVVQVGMQRRSSTDFRAAMELVRGGRLGSTHFARAWITSSRPEIGRVDPTPAPADLDFDLWCGPAPNTGYRKNLVPYHWHWRWDYGTGECGNNGVHALDVARWGLGVVAPTTVCCGGGKYFFDDDQQTPDTQLATFDFPHAAIQWEHRTWSPRGIDGDSFGVEFYGSKAALVVGSRGWVLYEGAKEVERHDARDYEKAHLQNFLDCLASREKPNADIEIGHHSAALCHLANIAWRTRSTLQYNGAAESIAGNDQAAGLLARSYRPGFEVPASV